MIGELIDWSEAIRRDLDARQYIIRLHAPVSAVGKASAYVEVVTPASLARLTLWETGEYEDEALDIHTGRTIHQESGVFQSVGDLRGHLDRFLTRLGISTI